MSSAIPLLIRVFGSIVYIASDLRITAPLLLATIFYPIQLRNHLPPQLSSSLTSTAFTGTLNFLVGFAALRNLNERLSRFWLNNGKPDAKFNAAKEIVLVTGGSSGIGELVARNFAAVGARVVVWDVHAAKVSFPENVTFYKVDVTKPAEIAKAAAEVRKSVGEPTVLINNAGIGTAMTILGGTEENVRRTFEVNTMSHFWMVKEFVPTMAKLNHGHIVTVASMASFVVHAQNVDYCCTKASALAFHEGLASELRHRYAAPDVRTTVVHPSWVRTPLTEPLKEMPNFTDYMMEPEEVADAITHQVLSGRSGQLILPAGMLSFVTGIRGWPSWIQEHIRNSIGMQLAETKVPT